MLLMEESWRVLFEAKAFQERAWLEARMRVKMEEVRIRSIIEVVVPSASFTSFHFTSGRSHGRVGVFL